MAKVKIGTNAQFTGAQLGLTVIGDRCYAFSGSFSLDTSVQTLLEFNTGKGYIVATMGCCGPVNPADIGSGSNTLFRIYINGIVVAQNKQGTSTEAQPTFSEQTIIIPPYSTVKVDNISTDTTVSWKVQAYVTGRIYDA